MTHLSRLAEVARAEDRLLQARDAGLGWLTRQISTSGNPVGSESINSWYRLPWALAGAGRDLEAGRVLSWIERSSLTPEGDLIPGPAQSPWTVANAPYPLGNIAIGAWQMERYDTARKIMDNLKRFQNPKTGGAFVEHPDFRSTGRQDVLCTAQLGLAGLMCGRPEVAEGAFKWFSRLLAAQDRTPTTWFISTDAEGDVVTEFDPDQSFGHVIHFQEPRQAFFNPGIAAAFLARYYMATGETSAKDLAARLLAMTEGGTSQQYDSADTVHVGKYAWGASVMLEVDPQDCYLDALTMMADWLADCQETDGRWNPSAFLFPEPSEPDALWKTAEHIMIINFMLGALGALESAEAHDGLALA
jgi:hypothetical protein